MYNVILSFAKGTELAGRLPRRMAEMIRFCCFMNEWRVDKIIVAPDCVQILLWLPDNISVDYAIKMIKDFTNKVAKPKLKKSFNGVSIWEEGYFVETIGTFDPSRVEEYLKNSREKQLV